MVRYEGAMFRPPSEADAFILQATIGCSWNHCTYCAMYRDKSFRVRPESELVAEIRAVAQACGDEVTKVFVADGDALVMPTELWLRLLAECRAAFPRLKRVSCYAMARNVMAKSAPELAALRLAGLRLLYLGPESGDDETLRRVAKGDDFECHVEAARKARAAGLKLSVIALLGIGMERSHEHAEATARLVTEMDPRFFSALTLTVVPGTPLHRLSVTGRFRVATQSDLLGELRTMVDLARPTDAIFRTNHASNYLTLEGRLPKDRGLLLEAIDQALRGDRPMRPEWARGL